MKLYSMPEHPESFPVNALVPISGTPMEENEVRALAFIVLILFLPGGDILHFI